MNDELREKLAEYAHDAWSGWMEYLFSKGVFLNERNMTPEPGEKPTKWVMPAWAVERWTRQMRTEFSALPDDEKQSDYEEADKILKILSASNKES